MALLDIIGHPSDSGELTFARGNAGIVEDIVAIGQDVAEIPAVTGGGGGGLSTYGYGSA